MYDPNLIERMATQGWKGAPVDVVRLQSGELVTLDNTRLLAASRAGIEVKAVIREASDLLPKSMKDRFTIEINGMPNNWDEALQFRINKQNKIYRTVNPQGSYATGSKG